ncbi:putative ABC transporter ATP-binding protein YbbL [Clostridium liquoris]|jgi:putative ABC transport system ATP-binding protein|uniref:Putative ABC transporter ATP-binding protein YbbL n=1 Tax=Clostridium liquoris TaxID=1289519 RepID=A0A2T0B329_9CLOT|nr:ATP-binding cassette domain-containing protein [Clostridium liquoris]PRR78311.1 putative ABC transporter ATP-binding protein YbbL [Clostridium liquoris]
MSILEFSNVSFSNDGKSILKNLNIHIESGDYISIVGPSGSGKSTFLKLCNNLISPSEGNISFNNKNISEYNPIELRKEIAYCFQMPHLFGNTVMDNLSFPFKIRNKKVDMDRIKYLFSLFSMDEEFIDEKVLNLSGGEKQRIALMRTLMFAPEILLLDEVTSALDSENTLIVENIINKLNSEGSTVLWVTHNKEQSTKYANKLLTLENGEIKSLEVLKNE